MTRQTEEIAERWLVSGRVQGVGFRYFVEDAARGLDVTGDVRNLPDGRVEVRARGARKDVDRLLGAVRSGPPSSRVDGVEVATPAEMPTFSGFRIRF